VLAAPKYARRVHPIIEKHLGAIVELCRKHHARSLALFGSAATGSFDPGSSDLDFLVEFDDFEPVAFSAAYFGLLEGLTELFGRQVDLVVESSIQNPYFRESVEKTRTPLYAA
jgi:predicted nucleotidyltransferase